MDEIKRYRPRVCQPDNFNIYAKMEEDKEGEWVNRKDHKRIVEELKKEIEYLLEELEEC